MVELTKIKFEDEQGKEFTFNIPNKNRIKFDYHFGTIKEEDSFVGGYILALPKEDIKAFLERKDKAKKLKMKSFGFKTEKEEVWFKVPATTSLTFHKVEENSQKAANFSGTVFVRLITSELN